MKLAAKRWSVSEIVAVVRTFRSVRVGEQAEQVLDTRVCAIKSSTSARGPPVYESILVIVREKTKGLHVNVVPHSLEVVPKPAELVVSA
jgi:hypothetical protein